MQSANNIQQQKNSPPKAQNKLARLSREGMKFRVENKV
jgi:hypothetical protein